MDRCRTHHGRGFDPHRPYQTLKTPIKTPNQPSGYGFYFRNPWFSLFLSIGQKRREKMAIRIVGVKIRIKTPEGKRVYANPVWEKKGSLKPLYARAAGKA